MLPVEGRLVGWGEGQNIQGHPQPGNPINHRMLRARQETWAGRQTTSGKLLFQPRLLFDGRLGRESPECLSSSLPRYFPVSG